MKDILKKNGEFSVEMEALDQINDSIQRRKEKTEGKNWSSYFRGFLFAIFSELFLAISNVFIKKAELFSVMEQALVRYCLTFISMFVLIKIYKQSVQNTFRNAGCMLLARGLIGALSILFTMSSLKLIDPSDTIALVNLNIIFVAVLAKFFLPNEKLGIVHYISIPITLLGNKN
jgi:drug/metabolite transporter (DMT)-like permease